MTKYDLNLIHWPCDISISLKEKLTEFAICKTIEQNNVIALQNIASAGVSYITNGVAAAALQTNTLKTINNLVVGQGNWLGDYQPEKNNLLSFNVIAVEPITLFLFENNKIKQLLNHNMEAFNWLYQISKQAQPKWLQSQLLSSENKLIRVVYLLLEIICHQTKKCGEYQINMSQQQLSEIIGISRQRVNEVLIDLQSSNYIILERNTINIIDLQGLGSLLDKAELSIRDPRQLLP